jgi:predicted site-specific integrase-resolvase
METTIELFLTRSEAAQFAGVCKRTIDRWTKRGFLTPVIGDHAMRFSREDVEEVREKHQKRHRWQAAN